MSNPKSERIHIHIEPAVAEALRAESAESGAPVSEIIRRAIALRHNFASAASRRPSVEPVVFVPRQETR